MRGVALITLQQRSLGMKRGFTLIELLVVVLIIGILAAIALPQYQLAVAKSRASRFLPMMDSIANAKEVYYLEHGEYPHHDLADDMDIQMPSSCTARENEWGTTNEWFCGDGFVLDMNGGEGIALVYCPGKDNGKARENCYPNAEYRIWRYQNHSESQSKGWMCWYNTEFGGKVCNSLNMPVVNEIEDTND